MGGDKYYTWKWFWRRLILWIPKSIIGAWIYFRLLRRKEDTHYIVLPNGIGDCMGGLAFLEEYKRQKQISHVTVVGVPAFCEQVCRFYPRAADQILYLKRWQVGSLESFAHTFIGDCLISLFHRRRIAVTWFHINLPLWAYNENRYLSFPMYFKLLLYQIGEDARPATPQVPILDLAPFEEKYGIIKGKTVFFNTVAKSVWLDIRPMCEKLAATLTARGYLVVTLTANEKEQPVNGTRALPCTLAEAYRLVEYGGTLVGIRSGFMDVMVFAKCKIVAVNDAAYTRREFFALEKWGVNSDCHSVVYKNDDDTLREILSLIG